MDIHLLLLSVLLFIPGKGEPWPGRSGGRSLGPVKMHQVNNASSASNRSILSACSFCRNLRESYSLNFQKFRAWCGQDGIEKKTPGPH